MQVGVLSMTRTSQTTFAARFSPRLASDGSPLRFFAVLLKSQWHSQGAKGTVAQPAQHAFVVLELAQATMHLDCGCYHCSVEIAACSHAAHQHDLVHHDGAEQLAGPQHHNAKRHGDGQHHHHREHQDSAARHTFQIAFWVTNVGSMRPLQAFGGNYDLGLFD